MASVSFNLTKFRARYPEFSTIADETLNELFPEACLYCTNTDSSPIRDTNTRLMMINMLVAHIAALNFGVRGAQPSDLVGRVSSASEGSVSVSSEMSAGTSAGTKAWFYQTKYGAAFWHASLRYRGAIWVSADPLAVPYIPQEM